MYEAAIVLCEIAFSVGFLAVCSVMTAIRPSHYTKSVKFWGKMETRGVPVARIHIQCLVEK
jgi:hypothetical protein